MAALDHRRIAWSIERAWLRQGLALPLVVLAVLVALVLGLDVVVSTQRLAQTQAQLDEQLAAARGTPARAQTETAQLPLPDRAQRFEISRQVLRALKDAGLEPARIRYSFDAAEDAGLVRQVASFTLNARWSEVSALLADLQQLDRALYISRLKIAREGVDDERVVAEIQIGMALAWSDGQQAGAP